jgi:hypothetical protein
LYSNPSRYGVKLRLGADRNPDPRRKPGGFMQCLALGLDHGYLKYVNRAMGKEVKSRGELHPTHTHKFHDTKTEVAITIRG